MPKLQYRFPNYYPIWLRVFAWIHLHLEHYCSNYCKANQHKPKEIRTHRRTFVVVSRLEFWLRPMVKACTKRAKEKYNQQLNNTYSS